MYRAATLCGLRMVLNTETANDILTPFEDQAASASWARKGLAFCCQAGIIGQNELMLRPLDNITRGEIVVMLYKMLQRAELL